MTALHRTIFGGFRQLGISEEADQRAVYQRVTGETRLASMNDNQKEAVVTELRRLGFTASGAPRRANGALKLTGKYAAKLQALWIAGYNLGIVRDRDDAALISFVHRQTGLDHARFLHHADHARRAVEALKGWLAREGWVDWHVYQGQPAHYGADGYRIALAQWRIIHPDYRDDYHLWPIVTGLLDLDDSCRDISASQWIEVMNYLGKQVRKIKKKTVKP